MKIEGTVTVPFDMTFHSLVKKNIFRPKQFFSNFGDQIVTKVLPTSVNLPLQKRKKTCGSRCTLKEIKDAEGLLFPLSVLG
jgi:hypothetical protein